jgi:hypothetical protein
LDGKLIDGNLFSHFTFQQIFSSLIHVDDDDDFVLLEHPSSTGKKEQTKQSSEIIL